MDGEAVHDFSKSLGSGLELCSEFSPQREPGWVSGLSGYGILRFGHDWVPAPSYGNRKYVSNKRKEAQRHKVT
jgi:hypothetical protein